MAETKTPDQAFIEKCFEFLAEEGYRPKMDGETIDFKKEGQSYWISFFGNPQNLFLVSIIYSYNASYLDRIDALELANESNGDFFIDANVRVARNSPNKDVTAIVVRSVCYIPDFFEEAFDDKIDAIEKAYRRFHRSVLDRET